jgi:hypothetical protein
MNAEGWSLNTYLDAEFLQVRLHVSHGSLLFSGDRASSQVAKGMQRNGRLRRRLQS